MKKTILLSLLIICTIVNAEIVYLNDGSILNGSITNETETSITIETKYQTRTIPTSQIKRILYGARDLEEIYILMKNGDRIHAWQVIQDNEKIIIRRDKNKPDEETIFKRDIRQMGPEEIMVFNPEVDASGGLIYFFNSGSSSLETAWIIRAGMYYDIPVIAHTKACLDSGYASGEASNSNLTVSLIPIYLSGIYEFTAGPLIIYPKLGMGATIISMDDKEKEPVQGVVFTSLLGGGMAYPLIKEKLFIRAQIEEISMWDNASLHSLLITAALGYRF